MSLRIQLLAFGLLTLVLPWAGWRYVREMETALRGGLEQSLLASAGTVAAALGERNGVIAEHSGPPPAGGARGVTIYAQPLSSELRIDGLSDDWGLDSGASRLLDSDHRFRIGVRDRYAYVFIATRDDDIVYQAAPGRTPHGDRIVLLLQPEPGARRWLLMLTGAPGAFRAQQTSPAAFAPTGAYDDRVLGAWRESAGGFSVEMQMPLSLVSGGLGFAVIDVDSAGAGYDVSMSATWSEAMIPGPFVYRRPDLQEFVAQFGQAGDRFRVLDEEGWVLSDAGTIDIPTRRLDAAEGLFEPLFRWALSRDDPPYETLEGPAGHLADDSLRKALAGESATAWYRSGRERSAIVTAAAPIRAGAAVTGAVLLERASDPILTLTNRAQFRLMTLTALASVTAALGLFSYATLLSFRVRRLARAAETALDPSGEIRAALPGGAARDELGALARSFAGLLERLREHTEYLRTLSSKLSHELRTPLAIVSTSLDNLEHDPDSSSAPAYLRRLREGTDRLDSILAAMSEAGLIEQAIDDTAVELFDLAAVVAACCEAYADIYPDRAFAARIAAEPAEVRGSADLAAQMLDKLVDNAVSFSPSGSRIDIELEAAPARFVLSVANRGPQLPATMRRQLFDSLVSVREKKDSRPHLGLGLHVVALIAKFHGARVEGDNLADGSGVVFRVWFHRVRGAAGRSHAAGDPRRRE